MDNRPIGVFDSGVGGLTVVKEILKILPNEKIIYVGDTARVPWGTRGEGIIRKFSYQLASFLVQKGVKIIVVACHTASSVTLSFLKRKVKLPLLGVIEPTVGKVVQVTKNGKIGVIGTPATIESQAWQEAIKQENSELFVSSVACPLFVPLVEQGLFDHKVVEIMAQEYLTPLKKKEVDTLVLACTHYPLLKKVIKKVMGGEVIFVNPGEETAKFLKNYLARENALSLSKDQRHRFYFTDPSFKALKIAQKFLGEKIDKIRKAEGFQHEL